MSQTSEKELMVDELKMTKIPSTPHFVLVHGLGGGGWCWYKIRCLMESSGFKVTCIDLKSAGTDRSDPEQILTFEDYNKPLMDFLSCLPDNENVILVGHSAGGLSVTHAINEFGKKIDLAIFIGATMLRLGFWTDQDRKDGIPDLSSFGDVFEMEFGLGSDQPPTRSVIKTDFLRKIGYQMCCLEDWTLASMLTKTGPVKAITSAQFIEGRCVDKVTRVYIKTLYDNVLKPEQQDSMIKRWPPSDVFVLESDHNPLFSAPFVLFGMLVKATASIQCV